ncbi:MAG: hypothetical protein ACYC6S_06190 [Desulfobulbia bacterium]
MTAQEAPGNQATNDPLKLSIQLLMQHSEAFFNALEQSEKWLNIEPELMAAITTIEGREIVPAFEVCRNLEGRISAEDQFNLHGFLTSRMAIESLAHIRRELPEDPLKIGFLAYCATAAGAALQRLQGAIPVKKALDAWAPYVERDEIRQGGCSTGGINSGESRKKEVTPRHKKVIAAAEEMLAAGRSYSVVIGILHQRPFKSEDKPYSKRHIDRILTTAGLNPSKQKNCDLN